MITNPTTNKMIVFCRRKRQSHRPMWFVEKKFGWSFTYFIVNKNYYYGLNQKYLNKLGPYLLGII